MSNDYEHQMFWESYGTLRGSWFRLDKDSGLWGTIQKNYGFVGFQPEGFFLPDTLNNPQDNGRPTN